jgi:molybdopterin/thiamine biosynthesis adenylyltransferase
VNVLQNLKVAVLGCGSLGSAVSMAMAQTGVGSLTLLDPEDLAPPNIGRHALGAEYIDTNKAQSLAKEISKRFPHITTVSGDNKRWEDLSADALDALAQSNLIISTMGDWASECALNDWHLEAGRVRPIVYGWTEAHGCAGHAVAIHSSGGCLQCGFSGVGKPHLTVTKWPNVTLKQEPGCGAVYQPYGPVELGHIVSIICELALDCLLNKIDASTHRIWAGSYSLLETAGGSWSSEWMGIAKDRLTGGFSDQRSWAQLATCRCNRPASA